MHELKPLTGVGTDIRTFFGDPSRSWSDAVINVGTAAVDHELSSALQIRSRVGPMRRIRPRVTGRVSATRSVDSRIPKSVVSRMSSAADADALARVLQVANGFGSDFELRSLLQAALPHLRDDAALQDAWHAAEQHAEREVGRHAPRAGGGVLHGGHRRAGGGVCGADGRGAGGVVERGQARAGVVRAGLSRKARRRYQGLPSFWITDCRADAIGLSLAWL